MGTTMRRALAAIAAIIALAAVLAGAAAARPWATIAANTPPKVTKQPVGQTVEEGQSASFTSTASGSPTPSVQWELSTNGGASWSPIEGATATTLTIASTKTTESGYQFRAVFKNIAGEVTSKAATLTVRKAPAVTQQPVSLTVEEGETAVFEAAASGFPAPTVQWQTSANGGVSWANVVGATSSQLTLTAVKTISNGHQFRAVFTNVAGKATSEAATLTVRRKPAITKDPASATVDEGETAVFEATASGFPAPTVQWERSTDGGSSWSAIEGATSTQLTVANAKISQDGTKYRAVFTNPAGSVTSQTATLTVHAPPVVTQQPAGAIVEVGEGASFEAAASGFPVPTVQWEISTNGGGTWKAIEGATSDTFSIAKTVVGENGYRFRAVFTSVAGTATSDAATLTVATTKYAAVSWGQNLYRQLGNGSNNALSDVPVPVSGLKFVTAVAAGGRHSLGLLANGAVLAWGNNEFGQLGNGTIETSAVPVEVSGLSGVKQIAAGANHSLALLGNGTVMAWGSNESGQLGDGGTKESEVPVAVKGLTNVKAIAAGGEDSLALLASGTVMAWGNNLSGQLGDGKTGASSNVPVAVKGVTGATEVSAGGEFGLALSGKGTVQSWGNDEFGQLGNSGVEATGSDVPVAVEGLSGVSHVAAGETHALAMLSGGTVLAWGQDSFGELGNGSTKERQVTPVAVSGLSGVSAITAGSHISAALLSSGSIMAWGVNQWGTLGNGTTGSPSSVPVAVSGLGQAASVSAGGAHMLAFGEPIPAITSVSPKIGTAAGGTTVTISGASFTGATAVKFGATEAAGFTVESGNTITATAPPGSGTVDIRVTTPSGISAAGPQDRYTYQLPPVVTKLSPKSAPTTGGTTVTITGSEFTAATNVSFGGVSAAHFTVNSPTSITAVTPIEAAGVVHVTVTNTAGTSALTSGNQFKFTPAVESVAPAAGHTTGGTSVTVTGTGFSTTPGATTFKFGKSKATAVECASSTTCTMLSPAHEAGTVDVTATVAKAGSPAVAGDRFTYS